MNVRPFSLNTEDFKSRTSANLFINEAKKKNIDELICSSIIDFYGNMQTIYIYNEAKKATEENPNDEFRQLLYAVVKGHLFDEMSLNFIISGISPTARKFFNDITGDREIVLIEQEENLPKHVTIDSAAFDEFYCVNTYMENKLRLGLEFMEDFNPKDMRPEFNSADELFSNQFIYDKNLNDWNTPSDVAKHLLLERDTMCHERFLKDEGSRDGRMLLTIKLVTLVEFIQSHMCNMQNKELQTIAKSMLEVLRVEFPVIFNGISKPCVANGNVCVKPPEKSCGFCVSSYSKEP